MPGGLFDRFDAFVDSKIEADPKERLVGGIIFGHRGRQDPVSIDLLCKATGWNAREIKGIVEQLVVTHRMKIGASRNQEAGGYFMVVDAEDAEAAARPYRKQIFAMLRRLRVLLGPHQLRELYGQLAMEQGESDEQC